MFTSRQVITATALIRHFREFAALLNRSPQPLLITQRGKDPLVLVNADIFEELLEFKYRATEAGFVLPSSWEE